jgi:hypothetical protein
VNHLVLEYISKVIRVKICVREHNAVTQNTYGAAKTGAPIKTDRLFEAYFLF